MSFDFDEVLGRKGTACHKWDVPELEQGMDILPFTIADMDFAVPPCVSKAIKNRAEHPIYGYTHPENGLSEAFITWMKNRHGVEIEKEQLKPTTGILTGIALALRAVTKPGDKVLVFTPVYNPFFSVVTGAGCELVECSLNNTCGYYSIDMNAVEEHMKNGLKAIVFCNPHNPAGRVWTAEELDQLCELCIKHGVYLLSDEAHAEFALFGNKYTPVCALKKLGKLGISCISPNKSFNVPGISFAYLICTDEEIRDRVSVMARSMGITLSTIFSMVAAEAGYREAGEWLDEMKAYVEENSRYMRSFLEENMPLVKMAPHEGTFLVWLDCSCFGVSSQIVVKELKERYNLLLSPGVGYRGDGDNYIRFNLAAPKVLIYKGLERFAAMYRAAFSRMVTENG